MKKSQVIDELRNRAETLKRWRKLGTLRYRYQTPRNTAYYASLRAWAIALQEKRAHHVLKWGALELLEAAEEYADREWNAARCRMRRFDRALERWESRGECPVANPSRYALARPRVKTREHDK